MPDVDNFYLDANGILHKCTHNDAGDDLGGTEGDMYIRMCSYIDNLVQMVRPKRLLYIAIDGVAPRAKMNQQRQRRYRVARERKRQRDEAEALKAAEKAAAKEKATTTADEAKANAAVAAALAAMGAAAPAPADDAAADGDGDGAAAGGEESTAAATAAEEEEAAGFDSNCITPGTEFMSECAERLRYFIRYKMEHDSLWRSLRVVLSGADVPGGGARCERKGRPTRSAPSLPPRARCTGALPPRPPTPSFPACR